MNHSYDLRLAGILIRVLASRELQFPDCYLPFLAKTTAYDRPDWFIEVYFGKGELSLAEGDHITRFPRRSGDDFLRVVPADSFNICRLFVPPEMAESFVRHANWTLFLMPERLLLPHDRVILHSSAVIDHDGAAVLFTGPSGSGKSTQAALWEDTFGAEILNGDKVIISTNGNDLVAYGGPVAGSSQIFKNQSAPIKAIAYVRQGPENRVTRLDERRAFMTLYSQMIKSPDDAAFNGALLPHIVKMVETVPILELTCLPDASAAEHLRAWLEIHLPSGA